MWIDILFGVSKSIQEDTLRIQVSLILIVVRRLRNLKILENELIREEFQQILL